ncbi:MAG: PDC sensor domain-containing protein, partial [Gammaproteobacteria bacterium]|nr:PDC sensor domain-containing protein [Gammaproteobacteria bacterium]
MSTMSYLNVIERYHEYKVALHELLASTLSGITDKALKDNKVVQIEAMQCLGSIYPFVDMLYVLDGNGTQISDNIAKTGEHDAAYKGKGSDRSHRPYYLLAKKSDVIIVTEPYLSSLSKDLCVSAAIKMHEADSNDDCIIVLDINLSQIIEFLMGDTARRKAMPLFKFVY